MSERLFALFVVAAASLVACGGDDDAQPDAGTACGNGVLDADESCDGSALGGVSCLDLGWTMGTLGCRVDCTFDVVACVGGGPQCGNWTAEWGEQCDTSDLAGASCGSIGFGAGELACRADCTFDPTGCGAPATCGDHVRDGVEQCDGPDLGGETCVTRGHLGGDLGCGTNCVISEAACSDALCGDGVAEGAEECDGADLDGRDCVMLGHNGGVLDCTTYCLFDDAGCTD